MTLLELAESCERTVGPDRELDAEIAVAVLGFFVAEPRYEGAPVAYGYIDTDGSRVEPGYGGKQLIPKFTASIDAAMTLVPEEWAWMCGCGCDGDERPFFATLAPTDESGIEAEDVMLSAATPALALCAAALKARAA